MTEEGADLKRIVGSMIFASNGPLKLSEVRKCLKEVESERKGSGDEKDGGDDASGSEEPKVGPVSESELRKVVEELQAEIEELGFGFRLIEIAGGFRFETDPLCGKWLKQMLKQGNSQRLSQPALETLAIIAYRQPITRGEIERIRGVSVDHVVRNLLEFQLVKIAGRSELPGKPFLYGTTQRFLQHFGLKSIKELEEIQPMLKVENDFSKKKPEQSESDEAVEADVAEQGELSETSEADDRENSGADETVVVDDAEETEAAEAAESDLEESEESGTLEADDSEQGEEFETEEPGAREQSEPLKTEAADESGAPELEAEEIDEPERETS